MKITGELRIEPGEGLGIAGITLDEEVPSTREFVEGLNGRILALLVSLAETEARITEAA